VIALVTPAWRRYAVTRLALAQRAHLRDVLAGRGIPLLNVIVADDDNLDIAREHGFDTVETDNSYVGRKFNDGIEHAARQGADYIAVVGSDDWVHPDLFTRLPADVASVPELSDESPCVTWGDEPEAITGRAITLVDLPSGRMRRCTVKGRYGVIPWILPRKALEPSGFRPVNDRAQKGLDGSMLAGLQVRPRWIFHDPHPLTRVDFKTDTNLNSYEQITGAIGDGPETDPWEALEERYPAALVEQARGLHERMAA